MAKVQTSYICEQCGAASPKWYGKCPNCGSWSSLVETIVSAPTKKKGVTVPTVQQSDLVNLQTIQHEEFARATTGMSEFDRVLGGGVVPGMVVLLAGEPGIGKSTLLLELAAKMTQGKNKELGIENRAKTTPNGEAVTPNSQFSIPNSILYVAGEESPQQIKLRADRLGIGNMPITILAQTNVDVITQVIESGNYSFIIVDSVQTLKTEDLSSTFGSVGQVRECVDRLTMLAKRVRVPLFLVGHVTKEGNIAGPKVLEHIVDTVLVLEGDNEHQFRILRTAKNRFGSTDEVGVFTMDEAGLQQVDNPSQVFLAERLLNAPGSVVVPTMEGTRTILVEIQALTAPTTLAMPRRVGIGVDYNRLQLLLAILSRRFHGDIAKVDVFVNVAGGLKVNEPAIDLGVCLAVASAFSGTPLPADLLCFGEVGLLGEVRSVRFMKQRMQEAERLGYSKVLGPGEVRSLTEALKLAFPGGRKKGTENRE